jgi:large subunit ribosomal protein L5
MRLQEKYKKETIPLLEKKLGYKNVMSVPKIEKVVINVGLGKALQDAKYLEVMENVLTRISGQRPVKTRAKKSISNFKIREGMAIGLKVTLRGSKMWDFVEKLVHVALPRVRDFHGLEAESFDGKGNYNIGFKEYIAFPEIGADEVEKLHGLEMVIVTSAKTDEEGQELLTALGFPFKKD